MWGAARGNDQRLHEGVYAIGRRLKKLIITDRIDRLTSIRGMAALYVALYHAQMYVGGFTLRPWTGFLDKGYLAVDFFFILSGFILAYVYSADFDDQRGHYRRFLSFRLARIYPVHLFTLMVAIAGTVPFRGFPVTAFEHDTPASIVANVFLVHGWGLFNRASWNVSSWSISAEWFAYLGFPLFLALTRPARQSPRAAVLLAVGAIALLGAFISLLMPPGIRLGGVHLVSAAAVRGPFDVTYDFGLLRVSLEFLSGVFLLRAYHGLRAGPCAWAGPGAALCLGALLAVLHCLWPGLERFQDPMAVAITALLILCLALDRRWFVLVLETRGAVYLGEASYAIYMVHGLVLAFYFSLRQTGIVPVTTHFKEGMFVVGAYLIILLLAGAVVYEYIEKPARAALRRWTLSLFPV